MTIWEMISVPFWMCGVIAFVLGLSARGHHRVEHMLIDFSVGAGFLLVAVILVRM